MGPLHGIRVLDLSRVLAGPWCTQILADLGAEVIKVERPGEGDDTRHWGPPWLKDRGGKETRESAYYLGCNRGKSSITIDLASDAGRDLVLELAKSADILVENFKSGGLAAKGLGYEHVRAVNPRIIYCSITGFGQDGPRRKEAGYDYLIQGMGGLMSITGNADGEPGAGPQRVGVAVSDLTTGMYSAIAILGALHHRDVAGDGQFIDMALLDTQVGWLANQASNYLVGGTCPERTGAQHPNLAPYQPFRTSDGYVIIAIGNDAQYQKLCRELGVPELGTDARFRTNADRIANRKPLIAALEARTPARTSAEWMAALGAVGIPCGPINTIAEVFEDPQVKHRGLRIELDHPLSGKVPGVATPIRYSGTELEYSKAPPLLGEDTDRVLRDVLGKSPAEIAALRNQKVI
ncbi:MAG TPA: CaiB/BaiF CoA-transferase family protein [Gammaproteobacteria bacterium]|jgi:crotonobetainyl-CoA:carnitine CoA-transferase CaiB-like acyl-CoA transferase